MTIIATRPNFVYLLLLHSNGEEYAKKFQFTIEMQKHGFSSLSCSDKTTNEKLDGHTLKYRDLYT